VRSTIFSIIFFSKKMGFTSLSPTAKRYLSDHPEIKLNERALARLSSYDADTQLQWLVNPMVAFLMERCINQLMPRSRFIASPRYDEEQERERCVK
jgi:hypothetical protein